MRVPRSLRPDKAAWRAKRRRFASMVARYSKAMDEAERRGSKT